MTIKDLNVVNLKKGILKCSKKECPSVFFVATWDMKSLSSFMQKASLEAQNGHSLSQRLTKAVSLTLTIFWMSLYVWKCGQHEAREPGIF
jgi:hypothetical protein